MTEQPQRGGIGTRIRVGSEWNDMTSSAGYASSSLEAVHFGLGPAKLVERVELRWPSGATQVLTDIAIDRVVTVTERRNRNATGRKWTPSNATGSGNDRSAVLLTGETMSGPRD